MIPSPRGRGGVNLACLPLTPLFSGLEGRFGGRRVPSWGTRLTLFSGLEGRLAPGLEVISSKPSIMSMSSGYRQECRKFFLTMVRSMI